MAKYFISCFSGAKNMGDEFILKCLILKIFEYDKNAEIVVTSKDPTYTQEVIKEDVSIIEWHGIGKSKKSLKEFKEYSECVKESEYVIIGGGGLIQDVHTAGAIPKYLIAAILGKMYDKKVVYYSLGIGPIKRKSFEKIVGDISNNCVDIISVRDEESLIELKKLGVKTSSTITTDPVFEISDFYENKNKIKFDKVKHVGICFRQFKVTEAIEKELYHLIEELKQQKIEVTLFPFDFDEDIDLCNRIKEQFDFVKIEKNNTDINRLMKSIQKVDVMVSMRLHGVIASASYGIPSIAISYDPKVTNIQSKIGMQKYLMDIEQFETTKTLTLLKDINDNYEIVTDNLKEAITREKEQISTSLKKSLIFSDSNRKSLSKLKCIYYFARLIGPQFMEKLNKNKS